ncbi:Wzz/FepE/Etk N-terminal domain-containing protein [uncultured Porticoccus sp.]|uniref:LPS O-antigen chain length determinant protein WzzB n=1 Tax=uncultured Porticoccus sp. TaxID=1256050 RepID=UPI0026047AFC|nr:Wzz/FepE/Etk N-terminal domain-containing protein [uncultured Porticoccus sp.]
MERDNVVGYQQRGRALDSDEIDLIELFQSLWQQKLLIIAFTVVATLAAAAFAFLSTPEYETKSGVLPPRLSDIGGYNLGRSEAALDQFTVSDVYAVFKTNLLSGALKRTFFREIYLPAVPADEHSGAQDKLWEGFNKTLTIKPPDIKNKPDFYEVTVAHESPVLAAEWVNLYIDMAAKKTERDMQENVLTEIAVRAQVLERQINALRLTAQKRREDRIVRLREALVVAEAIGFDDPQVVAGKIPADGDLTQFIDGNLMYMRGAKAIRAELAVLEKRGNDDPFISDLRDLENQLDFLKQIDVNPDDVSVFTLDSRAEVPETPVKPNKKMILILGIILGGMVGVFAALIRGMFKKRKMQVG